MTTNPQLQERTCEVCDTEGKLCRLVSGKIWYCNDCYAREKDAIEASTQNRPLTEQEKLERYENAPFANKPSGSVLAAPISVNAILKQSGEQDTTIQVRADLFNAETQAIVELRKAIEADASIDNKPYALATVLMERFSHFKTVVFDLNTQLSEVGNKQRATQVYLNQLANQLRAEEREKLKIADISYKPAPPKIAKPKAVTTTGTSKKNKIDKKALRTKAAELGVSEFTLSMLCTAKNIGLDEAAKLLQATLANSKG